MRAASRTEPTYGWPGPRLRPRPPTWRLPHDGVLVALALGEPGQSLSGSDQLLEVRRLLVRGKRGLVLEHLIEEELRGPLERERWITNCSTPGSSFACGAKRDRIAATAPPSPALASQNAVTTNRSFGLLELAMIILLCTWHNRQVAPGIIRNRTGLSIAKLRQRRPGSLRRAAANIQERKKRVHDVTSRRQTTGRGRLLAVGANWTIPEAWVWQPSPPEISMQIRAGSSQISRCPSGVSSSEAPECSDEASRRDAVARWQQARARWTHRQKKAAKRAFRPSLFRPSTAGPRMLRGRSRRPYRRHVKLLAVTPDLVQAVE